MVFQWGSKAQWIVFLTGCPKFCCSGGELSAPCLKSYIGHLVQGERKTSLLVLTSRGKEKDFLLDSLHRGLTISG